MKIQTEQGLQPNMRQPTSSRVSFTREYHKRVKLAKYLDD